MFKEKAIIMPEDMLKHAQQTENRIGDFKVAIITVFKMQTNINESTYAHLMRDNNMWIERAYHEGYSSVDVVNHLTGLDLDEDAPRLPPVIQS